MVDVKVANTRFHHSLLIKNILRWVRVMLRGLFYVGFRVEETD